MGAISRGFTILSSKYFGCDWEGFSIVHSFLRISNDNNNDLDHIQCITLK
jgi:hypothetical protein